MSPRILKAGAAMLLLLAATWAVAQSQVYRCGASHTYTDKPCDEASLVDLTKQDNILKPGPTSVAPARAEKLIPPTIWPNSSRIVSTPAAPPSSIWSQRDSRQTTSGSTPAATAGRPGNQ